MNTTFTEDGKVLLRRIVENLAWRQLAALNSLGHCLKFVTDLDAKLRVAGELDLGLRLFREVAALYRELGWTDLESAVRDKLERIPLPESRSEFGVAYYVVGLAERVAMRSYVDCCSKAYAAIARSYVEAAQARPEPSRFLEFAKEPTNKPQAQQFLNRWVAIAIQSFGQPDSPDDARAVQLGLRNRTSLEMQHEFVRELEPFLQRTGLGMPDLQRISFLS